MILTLTIPSYCGKFQMLDAAIRTQNHAGPLKVVFSDVDPHCSCHIKHWQSMVFPHFSSRISIHRAWRLRSKSKAPALGCGSPAMQRIDLEGATPLAYGICQRSGKGSWEQSVVCTSCRTALLLNHGTSAKQQFLIGPNEACDEGRH